MEPQLRGYHTEVPLSTRSLALLLLLSEDNAESPILVFPWDVLSGVLADVAEADAALHLFHHEDSFNNFQGGQEGLQYHYEDSFNDSQGGQEKPALDHHEDSFSSPALESVAHYFAKPSAVQRHAIPILLSGRDVVARALPGTGRTTTVLITALLMGNAVVLTPSPEKTRRALARMASRHATAAIVVSDGELVLSTESSYRRVRIVWADVKVLLVDDADQIPFWDRVREMRTLAPPSTPVGIFANTKAASSHREEGYWKKKPFPWEEGGLLRPEHASLCRPASHLTIDGTRYYYVDVEKEELKREVLMDLLETISFSQLVVYCNTRRTVERVTAMLQEKEFSAAGLHYDTPPVERDRLLSDYRQGKICILVCTDLECSVSQDLNLYSFVCYDLSTSVEGFLRRSSLSRRKATSVIFVTSETLPFLEEIKTYYRANINELPMDCAQVFLD